jgi:hypothetical protein
VKDQFVEQYGPGNHGTRRNKTAAYWRDPAATLAGEYLGKGVAKERTLTLRLDRPKVRDQECGVRDVAKHGVVFHAGQLARRRSSLRGDTPSS